MIRFVPALGSQYGYLEGSALRLNLKSTGVDIDEATTCGYKLFE